MLNTALKALSFKGIHAVTISFGPVSCVEYVFYPQS